MWRGRVAEVIGVSAAATILIAVIAAPVLRAPSERLFGMELVGRHHDPFSVMAQWGRPLSLGVYTQPVTDITGALIARVAGVVAAYNWVVLLSFPLSAAAAYLLARYLTLAPAGASVAAIAYAFSPFHLAHAAYHPHIAQTEWIPLYLLALWWCLARGSQRAIGALAAATLAVTLSNFYGGLIAVVMTPVAVLAYWPIMGRATPGSLRRLCATLASLALLAAAGLVYAWYAAHAVVVGRSAFAFPRVDVFLYSARAWSFLVPPVAHPLLGAMARRVWDAAGVRDGLLEQQVYLGWSVVALALVAIVAWFAHVIRGRPGPALASVPILAILAMSALLCSLSPERNIGSFTFVRPSAFLYQVVPMFRSYARFGVVVQLMAVLLAGVGLDTLLRMGTRRARTAGVLLVVMAAAEYAVSPTSLWRDVLPTAAHRWVVAQANDVRAFDCAPFDQESESIEWLSRHRVTLGSPTSDCTEPNLAQKLAASGYTYLLVRRATSDGRWFAAHETPGGFRLVASFADGLVFAVPPHGPAIYTAGATGFSPREHDVDRSWQWMGDEAAWTVVNTSAQPIVVGLDLEMASFAHARRLDVQMDGHPVQTLVVDQARRVYSLGPLTVPPGDHEIRFHPGQAPTVARDVMGNDDARPLSFALGVWTWTVLGGRP